MPPYCPGVVTSWAVWPVWPGRDPAILFVVCVVGGAVQVAAWHRQVGDGPGSAALEGGQLQPGPRASCPRQALAQPGGVQSRGCAALSHWPLEAAGESPAGQLPVGVGEKHAGSHPALFRSLSSEATSPRWCWAGVTHTGAWAAAFHACTRPASCCLGARPARGFMPPVGSGRFLGNRIKARLMVLRTLGYSRCTSWCEGTLASPKVFVNPARDGRAHHSARLDAQEVRGENAPHWDPDVRTGGPGPQTAWELAGQALCVHGSVTLNWVPWAGRWAGGTGLALPAGAVSCLGPMGGGQLQHCRVCTSCSGPGRHPSRYRPYSAECVVRASETALRAPGAAPAGG